MSEHQKLNYIIEPHAHDVLSGRGNLSHRHPGNQHFRSLVKSHREDYVACPKSSKSVFSKLIYNEIHSMDPPGRFLKQDPVTKLWSDIGKKAALAKTRQALREGAPDLLRDLQTVEQFSEYISSECAQVTSTVQNNSTSVGFSNTLTRNSSSESLGSEVFMNNNKNAAVFQLPEFMSNQVNAGFGGAVTCVSESSSSSQSGDSVSLEQVRPNSVLQGGQMQTSQSLAHQLQQLFNVHSASNDAVQNGLHEVNSQVNHHQNFTGTINNCNFIENTSNSQEFSTTPFLNSAASNLQQQGNTIFNSFGSGDAAALVALLCSCIGVNSNSSNVNNGASGDSSAMQVLQSQLAFQQLQSQLGLSP